MPSMPSARALPRRALTLALLSAMSFPALAAGTHCQLLDDAGNPLPVDATATGTDALACGPGAQATGSASTAVGSWVDVDGDGLVDADEVTWAGAANATALGAAAQARAAGAVAIGLRAVAVQANSVALGTQAQTQALQTTTTKTTVGATQSDATSTTVTGSAAATGTFSGSLAIGSQARSNGSDNIALGTGAATELVNESLAMSTAAGVSTLVSTKVAGTEQNALALGTGARANGNGAIVIGAGATAEARIANVLTGFGNTNLWYSIGPATNSTVIGTGAKSQGVNNVVIGAGAATQGGAVLLAFDPVTGLPAKDPVTGYSLYGTAYKDENSTLVGVGAISVRGWGSAFGFNAVAYGNKSTAVGNYSYAIGPSSTAIGGFLDYNPVLGGSSRNPVFNSAYGRAFASGYGAQSLGSGAYAWGNYDAAVGPAASTGDRDTDHKTAEGLTTGQYSGLDQTVLNGSASLGFYANAGGHQSIAIGALSQAHDAYAIAIGQESVAYGIDSLAIGRDAIATWREDIAIGKNTEVWGGNGTANLAIGNEAGVGYSGGPDISHAVAVGMGASAQADYALALGDAAVADNASASAFGAAAQASGGSATALGEHSQALSDYDTAVGAYALAQGGNSVAVGTNAFALGLDAVASGYNAMASGQDSVAVGAYAIADSQLGTALGNGAMVFADNAVAIGANSLADRANTVSVGSAGAERQIVNVADGTDATDAVNKRQLDAAVADVSGNVGVIDAAAVKYDDAQARDRITLGGGSNGTTISNVHAGSVASDAANVGQLDSVAALLGGGASRQVDGTYAMSGYSVQGSRYGNVAAAFGAVDQALDAVFGRIDSLEDRPGGGPPAGHGKGIAFGSGSVARDAADTAIGQGATIEADGSTAVGSNTTVSAAATNAVAIGADASVSAASATAIGQGAAATAEGAVALGQASVADEANTVSVGSNVNQRRVTHVAAGSAATDAVNVQQMQAGDDQAVATANAYTDTTATQTLSSANSYTDSRVQQLSDQFSGLGSQIERRLQLQDKRIDRQGAMGSAMMNMSINAANSRSARGRVAAGVGWQNGETALSVGYAKSIGERASVSIGGAFSGDDRSAGVGFGVDL
ncbi:MAG TPA: YadA-like family protein [Stenotrophomonas sp.]